MDRCCSVRMRFKPSAKDFKFWQSEIVKDLSNTSFSTHSANSLSFWQLRISRVCNVVTCSPSGRASSSWQLKILKLRRAERSSRPSGRLARFEQYIIVKCSRAVRSFIPLGKEVKLWMLSSENDRREVKPWKPSSGKEMRLGHSMISKLSREVRLFSWLGLGSWIGFEGSNVWIRFFFFWLNWWMSWRASWKSWNMDLSDQMVIYYFVSQVLRGRLKLW